MQWFLVIIVIPYLCLFLVIFRNLLKIKPYSAPDFPSVFVSVIIPCRNEEKNLPSVLNDISLQDYSPEHFELIIIDDNSSDMTFNVASEFDRIRNLKVIKNKGEGKKQAIRTGVGLSSGSLIITSDADCKMGKSWIRIIASFYNKYYPDIIICPVSMRGGSGFLHRFQELEFLGIQGVTAGSAVAGNPVMCNGANLAFKKESYSRHSENLHDELISGDDIFLLHSIKKESPDKIIWMESENAAVKTRTSDTFRSLVHQRARWISKAGAYNDSFTKFLAIIILITTLFQFSLLVAGAINPVLLPVFLAVFLMKSFPDFMILRYTSARYGNTNLLKWFALSQFVYPVYIIAVLINYLYGISGKSAVMTWQ